jgi:hypothetical protein
MVPQATGFKGEVILLLLSFRGVVDRKEKALLLRNDEKSKTKDEDLPILLRIGF